MKLNELLAEFEGLDPAESLELLIDFADSLPPLSEAHVALQTAGECRVRECQTAVFLWVGLEGGRVKIAAHVPEKSPTVRGFVAMLVQGLSGATPQEAAQVPDDLAARMGLQATLGMTRSRGFLAIVSRIKRDIALAGQRQSQPEFSESP